jgi:hypothetical protein
MHMTMFGKLSLSLSLFLSVLTLLSLQSVTSHAASRSVTVDGLFAAAKSNSNDRNLTRDELKRYPKLAAIVSKQLSKGHVTKAEVETAYKALRSRNVTAFKALDADHDGKVTYAEVVLRAPALAKTFAYLDQGTKGYLTLSDFFSRKLLLDFKPAASSKNAALSELLNASAPHTSQPINDESVSNHDALAPMADALAYTSEAIGDQLPEGVLTWNQWLQTADALSIAYLDTCVAKVGCTPEVECVEEIVVFPGPDDDGGPSGPLDIFDPWGPIVVLEPIVVTPGDDNAVKPEDVERITKKIINATCIKTGEDCGTYSQRVLVQCYAETGLVGIVAVCRHVAIALQLACSEGQIKPC